MCVCVCACVIIVFMFVCFIAFDVFVVYVGLLIYDHGEATCSEAGEELATYRLCVYFDIELDKQESLQTIADVHFNIGIHNL